VRVWALRGWSRGFPGPVSLPAARDHRTSGRPMAKVKVIRRGRLTNEERERGFSVNSAPAPLPTYDALRDNNLRQYFESKTVQKFLQSSGWIDKEGRIVDLDKFRCMPAPPLLAALFAASVCRLCPLRRRNRTLGQTPAAVGHVGHLPAPPAFPPAGCCRLSAPSHPAAARQEQAQHYRARVQVCRKDRVLAVKGGGGDAANNSNKAGARPPRR
jgi:hypothetical protein